MRAILSRFWGFRDCSATRAKAWQPCRSLRCPLPSASCLSKLSYTEAQELFKEIGERYPAAEGMTYRDGVLVFGNFGGINEADFLAGIGGALSEITPGKDYSMTAWSDNFRSDWIEPVNLEGTRYGHLYLEREATGRDDVRGRQGVFDSLQIRATALFNRAVAKRAGTARLSPERGGAPAGRGGVAERDGDRGGDSRVVREAAGELSGSVRIPEYGTRTEGAVSLVGVHYSQQHRAYLDGAYYGHGYKGAERESVMAAADRRLRQRIHFYVNDGHGITPEMGVGAAPLRGPILAEP